MRRLKDGHEEEDEGDKVEVRGRRRGGKRKERDIRGIRRERRQGQVSRH